MKELPPAFRTLGERLHEAAEREVGGAARPVRRRRTRRRVAVFALAGAGLLAGAAGAAELIGVGTPLNHPEQHERFAPGVQGGRIVLQLKDPAGGLPFGVLTYRSQGGLDCVLGARVRGSQLGYVQDGRFRPLRSGATGACASLRTRKIVSVVIATEERPVRTLVYGRVRGKGATVTAHGPGGPRTVPAGPDGAFLFVYSGQLSPLDLNVTTTAR